MTDYYPLDDTRAGRVTQAVLAGGYVAARNWPTRLALLVGGGALVGYLNATDDDPSNDVVPEGNPLLGVGALVGGVWAATKLIDVTTARLPRWVAGVGAGVATFAVSEAMAS